MEARVATLRATNFFGSICAGALFVAVGIAKTTGMGDFIIATLALAAIAATLFAIYAMLSKHREKPDEMYYENRGKATFRAYHLVVIVLMLFALAGTFTPQSVDLCTGVFLVVGLMQLLYGITLAHLEKGGDYADD